MATRQRAVAWLAVAAIGLGAAFSLLARPAFLAPAPPPAAVASQGIHGATQGITSASTETSSLAIGLLVGVLGGAAAAGCRAASAGRRAAGKPAEGEATSLAELIPRPENNKNDPRFPVFMGNSGGYLSKSTRERHAITWTAKKEHWFEMPTGGLAIMKVGENLCYFRRKEQCIALGKKLRKFKIENYKIYRQTAKGEVIFMHPADGVFPEKVNKGRLQVNGRPWNIGQNPEPGLLKGTMYMGKGMEADPLTVYWMKAKQVAFANPDELETPEPPEWILQEDLEEYNELMAKRREKKLQEAYPGKSMEEIEAEMKKESEAAQAAAAARKERLDKVLAMDARSL